MVIRQANTGFFEGLWQQFQDWRTASRGTETELVPLLSQIPSNEGEFRLKGVNEESADFLAFRGAILLQQGDLKGALADFDAAKVIDPGHPATLARLAEVYFQNKNWERALEVCEKALEVDPKHAASLYLLRGNIHQEREASDLAIADYQKALSSDCDDAPFRRGEAYFHLGKLQEAHSEFLRVTPCTAKVLSYLGIIEGAWGNNLKSVRYLDEALALEPDNLSALSHMGKVFIQLGLLESALRCFNRVLKIDENHLFSLSYRGHVYFHLGRFHDANRDFDKVIDKDPKNLFCWTRRLESYYKLYHELQTPLSHLNEQLEKDLDDETYLVLRARVYAIQGRGELSLKDLNKILEKNPGNLFALQQRGDLYFLIDEVGNAAEDYTQILKHNPNSAGALAGMGRIFALRNSLHKAHDYFSKANRLDPYHCSPPGQETLLSLFH